eukprot:CAMPEP_0176228994 /NCGR_PEP_ID=MMETSP0121_2-20121125/23562_1 /TAXON_ID=160619 /ORGANISM="Kryptoperidinium foliaceum, Strain CCMP 1326" /LENGTH=45 /DNA_ID= /DNA_START= /DNA_END= /DNA_ORIENTATION=
MASGSSMRTLANGPRRNALAGPPAEPPQASSSTSGKAGLEYPISA